MEKLIILIHNYSISLFCFFIFIPAHVIGNIVFNISSTNTRDTETHPPPVRFVLIFV